MTVFCADVSNWQGDVDMSGWPSTGIVGCLAKALEGQTGVDAKWTRNKRIMAGIAGPGFVPGGYHYLNNVHPAADQCKAFLDLVPGDWIHGFDVEAPGPLDVDGWFREYRRHYPEKVVALYTNIGMWKNRSKVRVFDVNAEWGPVEIWVAGAYPGAYQAGTDDFRKIWSRVPAGADGGLPFLGFRTYALMQYSGSATVPGVAGTGNCDMSVAGSLDVLKRLASPNGGTDDMSQADVDAITKDLHAYIDKKFNDVLLGTGNVSTAVFSGTFGKNPDGSPRTAGQLLVQAAAADDALALVKSDDAALQAAVAAQGQQLAAATKSITDGVVSQLLGSGIVGIDEPKLRAVVGSAVHGELAATRFVAQPTT